MRRSFTKPHETISVPKSGSMIWDKAFSTSLSAVPVDFAEDPATMSKKIVKLKSIYKNELFKMY